MDAQNLLIDERSAQAALEFAGGISPDSKLISSGVGSTDSLLASSTGGPPRLPFHGGATASGAPTDTIGVADDAGYSTSGIAITTGSANTITAPRVTSGAGPGPNNAGSDARTFMTSSALSTPSILTIRHQNPLSWETSV